MHRLHHKLETVDNMTPQQQEIYNQILQMGEKINSVQLPLDPEETAKNMLNLQYTLSSSLADFEAKIKDIAQQTQEIIKSLQSLNS